MQTLRGVHRQREDEVFHGFLNRLRYGYINGEDIRLLLTASNREGGNEWLQIYAKNDDVDKVNASRLKKLDGDPKTFHAQDTFASEIDEVAPESRRDVKEALEEQLREALEEQCPSTLVLKIGAPVRLTHVRNERHLHRGMEGTVVDFDEDGWPVVELVAGHGTLTVQPCIGASIQAEVRGPRLATRKQVPLALAWATTLHKAQGMTLHYAATHVSEVLEANMGYVALSRVTVLAGLKLLDRLSDMTATNLRNWLDRKLCQACPTALNFHMAMLDEDAQHKIHQGRQSFRRLLENDSAWKAALQRAGFVEGKGLTYSKVYPDWALAEYGDKCYRCGKRGHWQSDCLEGATRQFRKQL